MDPLYPRADSPRTRSVPELSRKSIVGSVLFVLAGFAGFEAALQANEIVGVKRSGVVAKYDSIAIDSLPIHRPATPAAERKTPREDSPAAMRGTRTKTRSFSLRTPPTVVRGRIARGQSISNLLRAEGVSEQTIHQIALEMRPAFDFRHAQPGDSFRLEHDPKGEIKRFDYWTGSLESIHLTRHDDDFLLRRERDHLEPRRVRLGGVVESSLYQTVSALGEDPSLANHFADIFAWDIDFTRQLQRGDGFEMVYERLYRVDPDGNQSYVQPGRVLAAHFDGAVGEHTAIYFEESESVGGYFRPSGHAIERAYLAAPVEFGRISSDYSPARRHPILKIIRPHHGIDYAAREGTPVWSVAAGTVIFRGWNGGFGNLVKIRHANGYISYYAHLSRYGEGLAVGDRVNQKHVIGFVGHTGLATGSHVCFRVTKNGQYVNPMSLNRQRPAARSVRDESWADFERVRDRLLADLRGDSGLEFAENAL